MRILIVEDDAKVGQFIGRGLDKLAYSTKLARTCEAASDALAEDAYDAIILDLGLPDGDGLDLLKEWRKCGFNEPVLILSARDAVQDRIKGLNIGADDYLAKPFSFEELVARLRSLLRRQSEKKTTTFSHNGIKMDLIARTVSVADRPVDLTAREFALLELFMQNQGRVLTRAMIAEKIWESRDDLDANLLDVYMRRLRLKLEASPESPAFKTLRGIGYQFV